MFLLIPLTIVPSFGDSAFTFHNVSINSHKVKKADNTVNEFTFHNVSINSKLEKRLTDVYKHLHSTMFLLIRMLVPILAVVAVIFTFHNVSINSKPHKLFFIHFTNIYIPQCFY